jgi:hypothetical protein
MKTLYKILFFLLLPFLNWANKTETPVVKERTISKSYSVNADAMTQINNSFGTLTVLLSNENKISIDVTIKVTGSNEEKVLRKFNSIDVDFSNSSSRVAAKTTFDSDGDSRSYESMNIEINYLIKIPKNGNIDLDNKYGNITVDELNGSSKIDLKYGNLTLGQFKNKSNNFEIAYSTNSTIDFIDNLTLSSSYSKLNVAKNYGITIDGNYNDFVLQNVGVVKFDGNYTKIKSNTMVQLNCDGNYLGLKLGDVLQSEIESNYSTIEMIATQKTKNIILNSNYSHLKVFCADDFDFDFEITMSYGGLKSNLDLNYSEKSEERNSKYYKGNRNSKGKSKVKIASSYGGIEFLNK